jgi:FKBP-type peptidyl-prolyl cis-trans isomerase
MVIGMGKSKLFGYLIVCGLLVNACSSKKITSKNDLKTDDEKFSYAVGLEIGQSLKGSKIKFDKNAVLQGIEQVISGSTPVLTDEEAQKIKQEYSQKKMNESASKNKKEGEDFLAKNKEKEGVKTTASGLQYKVIKEGSGRTPQATSTVSVHYKGTLLDGTEFDSSYKRGQPAQFAVNQVIPGWTEALQLMKEGSKYELFIPSNIAYGERGAGGAIQPNSTLIFEVELLKIEK